MALGIAVPPMTSYQVGASFKLTATGSTSIKWTLDPLLTIVSGTVTSATITVVFNGTGTAQITLADTSPSKFPSRVTNLYGTSGPPPDCDSMECEECKEKCKQGGNSNESTYSTTNSIRVNQNFDVTLLSGCMAIQKLGSELNLCFYRPNGTTAPRTDGIPLGTGGGQGAHLGFFRQVTFDPNPTSPNFALVNAWDGSQTSYYFSYNDVNSDQVWSAGPNGTNELRKVFATGKWRETGAGRTYFDYDSQGRQFRRSDLNGGQAYFNYDSNNRVQKITGDLPTTVYFTYNAAGNLSSLINGGVVGQADQLWTYEYQNVGAIGSTLSKINNPMGCSTYFGYDASGEVVLELDALNFATYYEYSYFQFTGSRLSKSIPPDSVPTIFDQSRPSLSMTKYTSAPALATYFIRDPVFPMIQYLTYDSASAMGQAFSDYAGNQVATIDRLSRISYFGYDGGRNQIRTLDAEKNSAYFAFNNNNRQTTAVSKRWTESNFASFTTYYQYDTAGNRTRQIDALNEITATTYDRGGLLVKSADPRGNPAYYGYDAYGRQVTTKDALGNSAYFGYDPFGNRTRSVSKRWTETGTFAPFTNYFEFDLLNRPSKEIDAVGDITERDYSVRCNDGPIAEYQLVQGVWRATYMQYDGISRLTTQIDPLNNVATWAYVGATTLVSQQSDKRGNGSYFGYDGLQRTIAQMDALSNSVYFGYDLENNQTQMVGPRWPESSFFNFTSYYGYDGLNRRVRSVDPQQNSTYFGYDANGNQKRVVGPRWKESSFAAFTTYFEFDAVDRQSAIIDALGQKTYFEYDANGNRTRRVDHLTTSSFASTYFGYDALNRLAKQVDALGRTSYFQYDAAGNATQSIAPGSPAETSLIGYDAINRLTTAQTPFAAVTYYGYDEASNRTQVLNPRQFATYFGFDKLNRNVQRLNALQGSTYFGYDSNGNLTQSVGVRWKESSFANFTTYYQYDALNRLTNTVDAVGSPWLRGYDAGGNLVRSLPRVGGATYFRYESRNYKSASIDGAGNVTYFNYDATGKRASTTTPRIFTTYFGYDALNRVKQVLNAMSGTTYFGYDIAGNKVRTVDPLNRTTYFSYDLIDRLTSVTDALLNASYFGYDSAGNRNAEMDARANTTYYIFDVGNRLANVIDPLGNSAYYGYNLNSNLLRTVDNNQTVIYFGYDGLDRRTSIVYPAETQSFGYDAGGNLVATQDAWGGSYFVYDTLNRLSGRTTPRADNVYYGYDLASNLTRLQYPQDGAACYYGYDNAQRMSQLLSPVANPAYYTYDADSNVTKKVFGNGMLLFATYDGADRVSSLRYAKSDSTPIVYFDYARDVAGRILTIGRESDLAIYYSYDNIDRLTCETWRKKSDNSQIYAFSYSYDRTGNRLQMRREAAAGMETESAYYSYASDNSLTKRFVQPTMNSTYWYYDTNGSITAVNENIAGATYFAYGPYQLVTTIAPPSSVESPTYFYYDSRLNRYCENRAGAITYFLWDDLNLIEERNADGSLKVRYTHADTRIPGIGSIVEAQRIADGATYYQYMCMDHRGTVYTVTDASQNALLTYTQDAFGRQLDNIGGTAPKLSNEMIYQTNWKTPLIGGQYYWQSPSRLGDPALGRFIARDFQDIVVRIFRSSKASCGIFDHTKFSIIFDSSGVSNNYSFADDQPIEFVDPTGMPPYPLGPTTISRPPSPTPIPDLVQQLGDDDFEVRQQAAQRLKDLLNKDYLNKTSDGIDTLYRIYTDDDPEIANALKSIVPKRSTVGFTKKYYNMDEFSKDIITETLLALGRVSKLPSLPENYDLKSVTESILNDEKTKLAHIKEAFERDKVLCFTADIEIGWSIDTLILENGSISLFFYFDRLASDIRVRDGGDAEDFKFHLGGSSRLQQGIFPKH
jgi:YD repeat-containing protein